MVGASIGKIGLITSKNIPSLQNQNMWRFRPINSDISPIFIHFYVKHINKRVKNWSTGSAREFYKKDFFKKFKCVIPPKEELVTSASVKTISSIHAIKFLVLSFFENTR